MIQDSEKRSCANCKTRHQSVFCDLGPEQLKDLDIDKRCTIYKKGERIFEEGLYGKGLYCVNAGKIKLSRVGSMGKEQIVRLAAASDIMGYNSMLSGNPLSVSAYALEDANICFIPAHRFFELLRTEPNFSLKLLELTAKNWDHASKMVSDMAQKKAKQRLAEMLLWLKATFGLDENNCIDVKISREDIANMVGSATEAVIRLLAELNREHLIELQGKKILLKDIDGLVQLADLKD